MFVIKRLVIAILIGVVFFIPSFSPALADEIYFTIPHSDKVYKSPVDTSKGAYLISVNNCLIFVGLTAEENEAEMVCRDTRQEKSGWVISYSEGLKKIWGIVWLDEQEKATDKKNVIKSEDFIKRLIQTYTQQTSSKV